MLWCRRTSSVPSQLMLWHHWSSSVFLDFETFLHTVEGDMIRKVRVGKWLGEIRLGCSSLGRSQLLYAPGSPCFASMAPPHPFFFTSRTSGCLFVHHRLLHLNTLDAPAVSVMNFPLHFSEHQYKSLDLCCASWDFCRAPHQNLCLVFSSIKFS